MLGGTVALAPLALIYWPDVMPSTTDWAAVAALGMLCSAVAYIMFYWLIANTSLIMSMSVTLLIPVFGVFWGMVFLNEKLSLLSAVGGAITLVATAVVIGVLPLQKVKSK
jgi:drug/metabolite transporter (DMT)-like permease